MSGPKCCENPPTLSSSSGAGCVVEIGGLKAYVSGPSDSKLAIVLVPDLFGYEAPNLRKLADKVAAAGFYVVVPDFFYGDPFVPETMTIPVWIKAHGMDKGFEDAKRVIAELGSKGVNAIGAAGFCWGAKVVAELSKAGHIQAAVLLHPARVTVDDIKEIKAPTAILGAETDHVSPPELLKQFEEVLATKPEVNGFVKIFPGVAHGWAVRYKVEDEEAVKRAEEAHQNMMDWFTHSETQVSQEEEGNMSDSQCCENPPTLNSICGGGSVVEVGDLKAYVAGPSDSKHAILLVSDIFGYEAPKFRKLADKVAAAGFYVVVPDFFYGDPFVFDVPEKPITVWRESHGTDKGFEDAKPVIAALKSKGISTIGAAGFCWGAKVVVELAKSDYIQAAVLLHPSRVTVDDIKEVKAPIAMLGAEIDKASPPELLKQFEEVLSTKPEVNSYVKIFPGVAHGWSVRYKDENEIEVKSAEEAHQNMLDWFTRYVK